MPAGILTEHSVGLAAVVATVHRGELSPMAKATMLWSTAASRGARRGLPTVTVVKTAGNHREVTNSVYHRLGRCADMVFDQRRWLAVTTEVCTTMIGVSLN